MHLLSFLFSEKVVKIKLIKEEQISVNGLRKINLFRGKSSIHTSLVLSINYHNFVKFLGKHDFNYLHFAPQVHLS